jgi:folate-binding protein YgfZ
MQTTLIDLTTNDGLIEISGPDAHSFLQGQLTCDMREVTPETHKLGAYCNVKGRVRALFRIFIHNERYYLLLPHSILPNTVIQLKKYGLFSKVTIKPVSLDWKCFGIIGSFSSELLENLKSSTLCLPIIPAEGKPKNPRFILVTPTSQQESLLNILTPYVQVADFETWKLSDIRAGMPQVGLEITEQFLPHDLNLPALNAVSFSKGCYCGQEIIARMEYRAKLKRHLYQVSLEDPNISIPSPGTKLSLEQPSEEGAGTVILASLNSDHVVEMLIVN